MWYAQLIETLTCLKNEIKNKRNSKKLVHVYKKYTKKIKSLLCKINKVDGYHLTCQDILNKYYKYINKMKNEVNDIQKCIAQKMKKKCLKLEKYIKKEIHKLKHKDIEIEQNLAELDGKVEEIEKVNQSQQQAIEQNNQNLAELNGKVEEIEKVNQSQQQVIEQNEKNIQTLSTDLESVKVDIQNIVQINSEQDSKLDSLIQSVKDLSESLEDLDDKFTNGQQKLQSLYVMLKEMLDNNQSEIERILELVNSITRYFRFDYSNSQLTITYIEDERIKFIFGNNEIIINA